MKKSMKKYDLLALGEVLLKLAAPENERLVRGDIFKKQVGGAEFNVIAGASILGLNTGAISKLPDNVIGTFVRNTSSQCTSWYLFLRKWCLSKKSKCGL